MFVDGGYYHIVPADIDPGGGFCVTLDRDFAGETNMSCMLYLRKKIQKKNKHGMASFRTKIASVGLKNNNVVVEESTKYDPPRVAALAPSKVRGILRAYRNLGLWRRMRGHVTYLGGSSGTPTV